MSFLEVYALAGAAVWLVITLLWLVSLVLKNASIIDPIWGILFLIQTSLYFIFAADGYEGRKLLILILVAVWSLRLSIYIGWRNWGQPEDFRYAKWREENGSHWWWYSYLKVFLLQGVIAWSISTPLLVAKYSDSPTHLTIFDGIGVVIWAYGFFFEAMGDYQLARFKADPTNKGKVLNTGVWRYSRHPNYFGDAAQWWGFYLIALAAGGFWTIYAPAIMTYLLVFVSGVAMLERSMKKKPKYDDYMATTSAFIPWFPKKKM